jgi:hypothetical protein
MRSLSGLRKRVERLEGQQRGRSCTGYLIEIDREDFETEADYEDAIDAEIAAHRETCNGPEHGFIVAPTPCKTVEEWVARYGPSPDKQDS